MKRILCQILGIEVNPDYKHLDQSDLPKVNEKMIVERPSNYKFVENELREDFIYPPSNVKGKTPFYKVFFKTLFKID